MPGHFMGGLGRFSEAILSLEAAKLADPLSIQVALQLHHSLGILGRESEAQAEYERAKLLRGSREPFEHQALFRALASGDLAAVEAQFRRYLAVATVFIPSLQRMFDVVDKPAAALALLREDFENPASQDSMRMSFIALYAGYYGDTELALAALRRGNWAASLPQAIWDPLLRTVRKTDDFKAIVRELGLADYWRRSGNWGDFARPLGEDDFEIIA